MTRRNHTRSAFTLVELLVVIGIIVVLVSLLMAGVSAVRTRQQERTTEDIVYKLQIGIENQRKNLVDEAAKERRDRMANYTKVLAYCDNDEDRAQALLTYLKLRHAFPQTYLEATSNVTLTDGTTTYLIWPPHKAYAALPNVSSWSAHEQSAAVLFAGLSNLATGGNAFATDDATASAQIDYTTGSATARVFKDARGNPVGIKRFLSALQQSELNAAPYTNAKDAAKDPCDPVAKLAGWTSAKKTGAQTLVGALFDNNNKSITAYAIGTDKTLGTLDDVYGYRLLKLGNKGAP